VLLEAASTSCRHSPSCATAVDQHQRPDAPAALTAAQLAALSAVFAQHLPGRRSQDRCDQARSRLRDGLGVTDGAVAQRLEATQQRAYQLGAHRQVGVTDPSYLYVLVGHGYCRPSRHIEAIRLR